MVAEAEISAHDQLNTLGTRRNLGASNCWSNGDIDETEQGSEAQDLQEVRNPMRKRRRTKIATARVFPDMMHAMPSENGEDVSVVLPDGQRKFLYLKPQEALDAELDFKVISRSITRGDSEQGSLDQIKQWMEEIQIESCARIDDDDLSVHQEQVNQTKHNNVDKDSLLTTKYTTTSFSDLVSSEKTNRQVLKWVKAWDEQVFHVKPTSKRSQSNFTPAYLARSQDPNDPRPRNRVLLLTGPPGAGKTTLAQTVARHAGYRPVVVNASDERSASVIGERIMNAMQMGSIVTGDDRPTLLILDEIEGAANMGDGKGAISLLVKMANEPLVSPQKKRKNGTIPLTRPLIAICNNVYAPVLRQLRQASSVVYFNSATPQRLSLRLKDVCHKENILVRPGALELLCEHMDNDIRSCLHGIQFLITKADCITTELVATSGISRKDKTSDLFSSWARIFTVHNPREVSRRMKAAQLLRQQKDGTAEESDDRFQTLFSEMSKFFSDFDKFMEGVYENMLTVNYSDAMLVHTSAALDWIGTADIMSKYASKNQLWDMYQYLPTCAVAIHKLCSVPNRPSITFPTLLNNLKQRLFENSSISQEFSSSLSVSRGHLVQDSEVATELVTPLHTIITPNVRPLPMGVLSKDERMVIARVVENMVSLGLRYKVGGDAENENWRNNQQWGERFSLLPNLHRLFESFTSEGAKPSCPRSTLCHTISHEIDLARMRLNASKSSGALLSSAEGNRGHTPKKSAKPASTEISEQEKKRVAKASVALDFFGREIKIDPDAKKARTVNDGNNMDSANEFEYDVKFRFNEGFSNAVKRPVQLAEFLLH